jgi:hypothetical protein
MILLRQEQSGVQVRAYRFAWRTEEQWTSEGERRLWEALQLCAVEVDCGAYRSCLISDKTGEAWQEVWDYLQFLRIWSLPDSSELPGFTSWEVQPPSLAIETLGAGVDRVTMYDAWGVPDPVLQYRQALEVAAVADGIETKIMRPHFDRMRKAHRGERKKH